MRHLFASSLIIIAMLTGAICFAQETVNSGFEITNSNHMPRGWIEVNAGNHYLIQTDSVQKHKGKLSVMMDGRNYANASADSSAAIYNSYGLLSSQKIKRIEVSGWIKLAANKDSAVCILIQSLTGDTTIKSYAHVIKKKGEWQEVSLTFIPDSNRAWYGFYYGAETDKNTLAWFDDITVTINGSLLQDAAGATYEPTAADIHWLNTNLHKLSTVDADGNTSDMEAIGKLCNDATIVGIGEPTHGTGEALRFKLKLLQYLVLKKGFTTLMLEENIAACDRMNAIINNPSASIKDSLLSSPFYKLWKSEEVAAALQWIQIYNASHTSKVKFAGMDEEDISIKTSRQQLRDYGSLHDSNILHKTQLIDNAYLGLRYSDSIRLSDSAITHSANNLLVQLISMDSLLHREANTSLLDKETFFTLETSLRVCKQWLRVKFFAGDRDSCMADNIKFYMNEYPADKIMVWAHNIHISNLSSAGTKTMGAYLKQMFANKYVPVGFTSAEGDYVAATDWKQQKWNVYPFEKAYQGTYEYTLAKAKDSLYFLSMKDNAVKQKEAAWLRMPMKHLDISFIKNDSEGDYKYEGSLSRLFDGIVFCKTTTGNHSYMLTN